MNFPLNTRLSTRRPLCVLLLLTGGLLLPGEAHASCTITLSAPAAGATATASPSFRWRGSCAQWQITFSPSPDFTSDVTYGGWQSTRSFAWPEGDWNNFQAGPWAAGVYWRVEGIDSAGAPGWVSSPWFLNMDPDLDDDGFGASDCDDGDPGAWPGGPEVCDGTDNNCDGTIDEGVADSYWPDADGDGAGDGRAVELVSCSPPPGLVGNYGDCDDADPGVNPTAVEICNDGIDQDCDGGAGPCGLAAVTDVSAGADLSILGYRGYALTGAPRPVDLDGDGQLDLVATTVTRPVGRSRGALYAWYGPLDGRERLAAPDVRILGAADGDRLGAWVGDVGDLDGDGDHELAVSAELADGRGRIYVFDGPLLPGSRSVAEADLVIEGWFGGDGTVAAVNLGDLDGDGHAELAVASPGYDDVSYTDGGWIDVWYGPLEGTWYAGEGDVVIYGGTGDSAGTRIDAADLDGDGLGDLVVSAPGFGSEGLAARGGVFVCWGDTLHGGWVDLDCPDAVLGAVAYAGLGGAQGGQNGDGRLVGDLDGDGLDELLLSGFTLDEGLYTGLAAVCHAPTEGSVSVDDPALCPWWSASPFGAWGNHESPEGLGVLDLDGDGVPDLLLSAPGFGGGSTPGVVGIWRGPLAAGVLGAPSWSLEHSASPGQVFHELVWGDLNGDGPLDLAWGEPADTTNGAAAGRVQVAWGGGM